MTKDPHHQYNSRPARPSDLEWLIALRMKTMAGYLDASGTSLSHEDQRRRVLRDFEGIRIVTLKDQDIGMIKVVREPHCWTLVQIQLLPAYQGLGIGTRLIEDLLAESRHGGVSVKLSVLKVNPAKSLYDRLGFYVSAEKERSYEMQIDA